MPLVSTFLGSTQATTGFLNLNEVVDKCALAYDQALAPNGPLTKLYDNVADASASVKRTVIYQVGNFPHFLEIGGASSTATSFYQRLYTLAMAAGALPSAITSGTGVTAGFVSFTIGTSTNIPYKVLFSPNVMFVKANADGVTGVFWWFSNFSDGNWRGASSLTSFVHIDSDTTGSITGASALSNGKFPDGGIPLLPVCCYVGTSVFEFVPLNYFGYNSSTTFSFYQDTEGKYYYIHGTATPYSVFIE